MDIQSLFTSVKDKYNLRYDLKTEQHQIIKHVLANETTLGVLPTGYGKSATFYLPPLLLDEVSMEIESLNDFKEIK